MTDNITQVINVLDNKGYVRLVDVMGDDCTVANAARVSFDKRTEELTEGDERLIAFLAREGHDSPFRHAVLQFEVYAPMMVTRQWEKYLIGSNNSEFGSRNESSRRYITENEEFYIPERHEWRSKPEASIKQGSGAPLDEYTGEWFTRELAEYIDKGEHLYNIAMQHGIAPEQARLFLPAYGLHVRFRWTATLQTVAHLIQQRTADDAQYEFRLYAEAVRDLTEPHFPVSLRELLKERD